MGITGGDSGNGVGDGVVTDIAKLLREAMCYLQRSDPEFAARLESAAAEVESAEPDYWVSTDGVYVDFGMRSPGAEDDGANWCARTEVNQHINDSMGDQPGLRLHLEGLYRHPPSAPEGYVLVEKSVVPEHVLAAGSAAIVCAMQAGITSPRTLALAAYTDMVLSAAPQGGGENE
jgi:hypothetical protein